MSRGARWPLRASRGSGVRERDRDRDRDRGEMLRRGEPEGDRDRVGERDSDRSGGRADGGVCDGLRDRPRESDRGTMARVVVLWFRL